MTRREALQLAAAALASPAFAFAQARKPWAGYLTAAFAVDDVRRLLALDPKADPEVRTALMRHPDPAKLGCALIPPASNWKPGVEAEGALTDPREQLAVAAGAVIAHTVAQTLGREASGYDPLALDAALLAARHPAPAKVSREDYLAYLRAVDIRCQIELHTLDPDDRDILAWLDGVARWYRDGQAYLEALASLLASRPSSPAFDARDPLFRLSEGVRRAEAVTAARFASAKPDSPYGQALFNALAALRA